MNPSLYDLLDVDRDASHDEIRAAWKRAIADLDPTERRFRAYNDAAGVLLDPERRAAYDAELDAAAAEEEAAEEEAATDREDADEKDADRAATEKATERETTTPGAAAAGGAAVGATTSSRPPLRERLRERPSQRALLTAGVVAVVAVALTVWVMTWPGTFGTPPEERQQARAVAASSIEAAERIAPQVLSYDHRDMGDERLADLQELMTPAYGEEWAGVQQALRKQAQEQEAVVTAAVRASAVAGVGEDGGQAEVLVFVDQLVQKADNPDTELTMWATLRLIRDGDDWLLEKICTTDPECG